MAPADPNRTMGETRLARRRLAAGLGQADVARAAGLSERTYQRLEAGELANPGIRYLVACALVLECSLSDLIEDEWLQPLAADDRVKPPKRRLPRTRI